MATVAKRQAGGFVLLSDFAIVDLIAAGTVDS